mgnify:CR=1 FL=1
MKKSLLIIACIITCTGAMASAPVDSAAAAAEMGISQVSHSSPVNSWKAIPVVREDELALNSKSYRNKIIRRAFGK